MIAVLVSLAAMQNQAAGGEEGTVASLRAELQKTRQELNKRVEENERLVQHINNNMFGSGRSDIGGAHFPRILHQTGPDEKIPDRYAPYVKSWISNNPHWHYR
jgi:mannosyltransferase OCH1-like enzyme